MNPKLIATFLLGALAASIALNVLQFQRNNKGKPNKPLPPEPFRELDLTPAQVGVLNRCGTTCCEAADELRSETERVADELKIALAAEVLDKELVTDLAAKLSELRRREVDNNLATLIEVRNVLEPKQVRTLYRVLYPDYENDRHVAKED